MKETRMWAVLILLALGGTAAYGAQSRILDDFEGEQWINATADTELKHAGGTSARWDTAEKFRIMRWFSYGYGQEGEWTHHDFVDLWVHCPQACDTELWIKCHYHGTNARWGYYYKQVKLDWTGWKFLHIPHSEFAEFDPPYSWARIDRVSLEVDPASEVKPVLHVDDFGISKNALVMLCPSPPSPAGDKRSKLVKPPANGAPGFADAKVWFSYGRASPGEELVYYVQVANQSHEPQTAKLELAGAEGLDAKLDKQSLITNPETEREVRVRLRVPEDAEESFRRVVTVKCRAEGLEELETLPLRIAAERAHPCVAFSQQQVEEIRKRLATDGAVQSNFQAAILSTADGWDGLYKDDTWESFEMPEFGSQHRTMGRAAGACAAAYVITGKEIYAEKAAAIFRKYADPETGYVSYKFPAYYMTRLFHANYMGQTGWVAGMARAYDCLLASDVLSDEEKLQIEWYVLFAAAHDYWTEGYRGPNDGNATTMFVDASSAIGAVFNDPWFLDDAIDGPLGYRHLVGNSVLDGGFWYEGSWSYHGLSRNYLTMGALNVLHTLPDFHNQPVPTIFDRRHTTQRDSAASYIYHNPYTLTEKTLKPMFGAPLTMAFPDGSLPGLNDSGPRASAGGSIYASGYHLYRDPRYLTALGGAVNFQYATDGKPEPAYPKTSTMLPAAGMGTLRAGVGPDIACFAEFGSYGGGHGHCDNLQFVLWHDGHQVLDDHGYGPGYSSSTRLRERWFVRTIAHNCVSVDEMTQWASHSKPLFFGTHGKWEISQAFNDNYAPGVAQTRTLLLNKDVLVVVDDLASADVHTYDWVVHPETYEAVEADVPLKPREAFGDPEKEYDYACIYSPRQAEADSGCQVIANLGAHGVKIVLPAQGPMELITGTDPHVGGTAGSVAFQVHADEEELYRSEKFDAAVPGPQAIEVDITGRKELKLLVDPLGGIGCDHAVWANARLVDAAGKEVYLSDLPEKAQFVHGGLKRDVDYYGTKLIVAGKQFEKGLLLHTEGSAGWATWDIGGKYVKFLAELGLDNGKDENLQTGKLALRRTVLARKQASNARFVAVIEPYSEASRLAGAKIEGSKLLITMADKSTHSVDLASLAKLKDEPKALPFKAIKDRYTPPVNSQSFFERGVARDTISWPVETIRCHETVDDAWQYLEAEAVPVEAGKQYQVSMKLVQTYNYVLPPALKLYQCDAAGRVVKWEYLANRLPWARDWREVKPGFTAAPGAATAKVVVCSKGIGTLWVTPPEVAAAQ